MKTIQLSDEQLTVVLEAVRTRLMMGQFELEELRKMTNTVTTDALFTRDAASQISPKPYAVWRRKYE